MLLMCLIAASTQRSIVHSQCGSGTDSTHPITPMHVTQPLLCCLGHVHTTSHHTVTGYYALSALSDERLAAEKAGSPAAVSKKTN